MICYTCKDKLTKTTDADYGEGIADQCEYNRRSCKLCCDCGGH